MGCGLSHRSCSVSACTWSVLKSALCCVGYAGGLAALGLLQVSLCRRIRVKGLKSARAFRCGSRVPRHCPKMAFHMENSLTCSTAHHQVTGTRGLKSEVVNNKFCPCFPHNRAGLGSPTPVLREPLQVLGCHSPRSLSQTCAPGPRGLPAPAHHPLVSGAGLVFSGLGRGP